ncbi:MAG: MarC family protein [Ignavibacteria bacterium]
MAEVTSYIKIFVALMVLVNPIEGIPIFITNTRNLTREQKISIAKKASIAVFIILIISLFLGKYLLELFGIGIPSFSVAGGIIIFLIAVNMVIGTSSGEKAIPNNPDQDEGDIAVVPLATPLLAGPGAISSLIVYGSRNNGLVEDIILSSIVILVAVTVWFALKAATQLDKRLNATGIKVLTKISGLLVAAIAVELIISGLNQMIPSMAK